MQPTTEKELVNNFPNTYNKLSNFSEKEKNYIVDFGDNCEDSFKNLSFSEQVDLLIDWHEKNSEIQRLSKYEYLLLKSLYYSEYQLINNLKKEWQAGIRQAGYTGGDINSHAAYLISNDLIKVTDGIFIITNKGKKLFEKINF